MGARSEPGGGAEPFAVPIGASRRMRGRETRRPSCRTDGDGARKREREAAWPPGSFRDGVARWLDQPSGTSRWPVDAAFSVAALTIATMMLARISTTQLTAVMVVDGWALVKAEVATEKAAAGKV